MKNKIVKFIIISSLGVLGYFLLFGQDSLLTLSQRNAVNKALEDINKAPDFSLKDLNDSLFTLQKLEGKVILLNFWATWCGPCRMEIPEFNDIQKNYHEKGFEILGISVSDNKKQLKNFCNTYR